MREKFIKSGLAGFHDYEIIELLLTLGTPRRDCKQAAKEAIRRFGSLRGVLEAPPDELQEINGIGPHNYFGIRLIQETARKFLEEQIQEKPFCRSSREVFDYLYHSLRDQKKEIFKVIFLDSQNQIIGVEDLFMGSVSNTSVYPREVIERTLRHNASALIFAHNHPSGHTRPSKHDITITKDLLFAAGMVQIKVLDHVIIGNNRYFSFADAGLIEEFEDEFHHVKNKTSERMLKAAERGKFEI